MPYYVYETYKEVINEDQKKQAEREEKERENYKIPGMPNLNSFKNPKLPQISLPKY